VEERKTEQMTRDCLGVVHTKLNGVSKKLDDVTIQLQKEEHQVK
jgi:hypothetical protein